MKRLSYLLLGLSVILSACSRQSTHHAQGYIEGRYTYVATSVSGRLEQLLVVKGDQVKQGQLLFVLEAQPESDVYKAAVENLKQATSTRDAIAANLSYAKLTYERYKVLVPQKALQQSQLDNAKSVFDADVAQLNQANASIASAAATLAQAKWSLDQKQIHAPLAALVFDTYYRLGEYAAADKPIISLLAPADIKVVFYVNEATLGGIRLNDKMSVACNGCRKDAEGQVSFISPTAEYTPPVIFSTETNEKLVFRIEGKFSPQVAAQLHPGQPVTVTYYTHG